MSGSYTESEEKELIYLNSSGHFEQFQFGDSLTGRIPLPPLGTVPVVIPVSGKGISLELSITDTELSYNAVSRPVARSKLSYGSQEVYGRTENQSGNSVSEESSVRKSNNLWFRIVMWASLILILWVLWKTRRPIRKIIGL